MTKLKQRFSLLVPAVFLVVILLNFSACSKDRPDNLFAFEGFLDGAGALPPNAEVSTGSCNVTYDSIKNELVYTIRWKDLTGAPTAINFQQPATDPPGFTNVAIAGFPSESGASISGSVTIDQEHEADLLNDKFYLNISTSAHTEGEIRGQLTK
ncbi:MAG TPA: CHRD domain-containing protein [Parafilimonas sp.]|nr:CHRD domain-containing protein [Parafilimonas sp.]